MVTWYKFTFAVWPKRVYSKVNPELSDRNLLNKTPLLGERRKEANYMVPTLANLALVALGSFSLPAEQIMLRSLFIFSSCSLCGRIRKKQNSKCQGANDLKIDIT